MVLETKFILNDGRRRAACNGFYIDIEMYLSTLPGYTKNQIEEIEIHKFRIRR